MEPDLAIALKLLEVAPNRYVSPSDDHAVGAESLARDVTHFVEALWPMQIASSGGGCGAGGGDANAEAETAVTSPEPDRPGCLHDYCPRLVMVDNSGFFETFCERHLVESLRASIQMTQVPDGCGEVTAARYECKYGHITHQEFTDHPPAEIECQYSGRSNDFYLCGKFARRINEDRFANCRDRCKEVGMGGCACA